MVLCGRAPWENKSPLNHNVLSDFYNIESDYPKPVAAAL
jgi:hypothetical protein